MRRALSPDQVSRVRGCGPLRYQPVPLAADELRDPAGRVLARAAGTPGGPPQTIEVADNGLPGAWLLAIVLASRGQGTQR